MRASKIYFSSNIKCVIRENSIMSLLCLNIKRRSKVADYRKQSLSIIKISALSNITKILKY